MPCGTKCERMGLSENVKCIKRLQTEILIYVPMALEPTLVKKNHMYNGRENYVCITAY
jgi:hypothetical protein